MRQRDVARVSSAANKCTSFSRSRLRLARVTSSNCRSASGSTPSKGPGIFLSAFLPSGVTRNSTTRLSSGDLLSVINSFLSKTLIRLLAVDWWMSMWVAISPTPSPGLFWIRLSAQTWAPPKPVSFSTCRKCVLTALNTTRNCRSACAALSLGMAEGLESFMDTHRK